MYSVSKGLDTPTGEMIHSGAMRQFCSDALFEGPTPKESNLERPVTIHHRNHQDTADPHRMI